MKLDLGTIVIVIAVLFFYLRLILLQRQRVKNVRTQASQTGKSGKKSSSARSSEAERARAAMQRYSILSNNPRNRFIAATGAALILIGVLIFAALLPFPAIQPYWWLPVAVGIVLFSWGFA